MLRCIRCGHSWQSSWWARQLRTPGDWAATTLMEAAERARAVACVGEDTPGGRLDDPDCDSEVEEAVAAVAAGGAWLCGCGGRALYLCVLCGEPVCATEGCGVHGRSGCEMVVEGSLRSTVAAQMAAARDVTGCEVAMAGVWAMSGTGRMVQGSELRLAFPSLGVWARGEGMAYSWQDCLLPEAGAAAHRHVEAEGQRNPAVRRQAGFGVLAEVVAEGPYAVDHEAIKRRMRERRLQDED